ncbi:MAG: amidohydrolase [Gammaproteobacteria bacterium]|nr:amidohydrolase [Gammaproteobacteria bacterium]MBT5602386.1 amidohydrolase [Gammaproteobacteria bacterium]MBT6246565.1 amidohydrolase [Gammaproteobacteria bacterium]
MNLINDIVALSDEMQQWRRHIHAHPELAFKEFDTADFVAQKLQEFGLEIHQGLAGTGVIGTVTRGRSNRAIGLRADLDALPIKEANQFSHRSKNPGIMHACGHDGHTCMLLGAAKHLAQADDFEGTVHFIFQPAEENEGGARTMIEDGLFERFPVEAVYGMHNIPGMPVGSFGIKPGPMMAAFDIFDIKITGTGGHAAMPHLTVDPILVGTKIVEAFQTIVSRTINPQEPTVLSVTQFHAGDAYNVIPNEITISGCTRCFSESVQTQLETTMQKVAVDIAKAHGASVDFRYERRYPPTINSEQEAETARQAATQIVGHSQVFNPKPSMGSEDFAYMLQEKPGSYIWIGNGDGEGSCMVHNPGYDFNDEILPIGASYWVTLVNNILPRLDG